MKFKDPTSADWTPIETVINIMNVLQKAKENNHWGPYTIAFGYGWEPYFKIKYSPHILVEDPQTLRERILKIPGIQGIGHRHDLPALDAVFYQIKQEECFIVNVSTDKQPG